MLTQRQGLSCFSPHQRVGCGCTRSWERTRPGQLTTSDQRDTPDRTMSCSAIKAGGRRRKERPEGFGVMAFIFPSHRYTWRSPAFLGMAACRWKMLNEFLALLCLCVWLLLYPLNCLYLNPRFCTFALLILSPIPPWGSKRAAAWGWAGYQG